MLKIGYHVSIAGGIHESFARASLLECTAFQLFLTNPRTWNSGKLSEDEITRFDDARSSAKIREVVVHMPYLPNIASSDPNIFFKSVASLRDNLARCNALEIEYLVVHMGSHMGLGRERGLQNLLKALKEVRAEIGSTELLLENEAGHRNSIGETMQDLAFVRDNAPDNVHFCLDTCHLFAAGYDVRKREALDQIEKELGWKNVRVIHLNDAKNDLGSRLDRHENIGYGSIGMDGFRNMLSYRGISSKPLILETPENPALDESEELKAIRNIVE